MLRDLWRIGDKSPRFSRKCLQLIRWLAPSATGQPQLTWIAAQFRELDWHLQALDEPGLDTNPDGGLAASDRPPLAIAFWFEQLNLTELDDPNDLWALFYVGCVFDQDKFVSLALERLPSTTVWPFGLIEGLLDLNDNLLFDRARLDVSRVQTMLAPTVAALLGHQRPGYQNLGERLRSKLSDDDCRRPESPRITSKIVL
jgi:hypothetical protein